MPVAGWLINGKKRAQADVMSQAESEGHAYRFPPAVWEALWRQVQRVDGWWLAPSMTCPRLHILKASEDYWLDPEKTWMTVVGSAMHTAFEGVGLHSEMHLDMPLRIPLRLPGQSLVVETLPLKGTLDHYDVEHRRLTDYKVTAAFTYFDREAKKLVPKEYPQPDHVQQVNFYRLLLETNGFPVETAQIWYVQPTRDAPRKLVSVPLWDLDETMEAAVEAARPLALAKLTGELPECTCRFPGWGMDRDLCREGSSAGA